jgi:hypothetical protein
MAGGQPASRREPTSFLTRIENIRKRYLIAAAHNLSCLMYSLLGISTPKGLQAHADLLSSLYRSICAQVSRLTRRCSAPRILAPLLATSAVAA